MAKNFITNIFWHNFFKYSKLAGKEKAHFIPKTDFGYVLILNDGIGREGSLIQNFSFVSLEPPMENCHHIVIGKLWPTTILFGRRRNFAIFFYSETISSYTAKTIEIYVIQLILLVVWYTTHFSWSSAIKLILIFFATLVHILKSRSDSLLVLQPLLPWSDKITESYNISLDRNKKKSLYHYDRSQTSKQT